MDVTEKRIHLRKALQGEGIIADAAVRSWQPIKLLDISLSGIGFLCPAELPANAVRMVRFSLSDGRSGEIGATVRIAYCVKHSLLEGYRVGAEFKKIEPEHVERIDALAHLQ